MLAPSKQLVRRSSAIGDRLNAHYENSPFGQQTKATGSYASSNPFRFSSEYYDTETGLVYYNYRYYYAKLGRWLSRDPIGENGGVNLYATIENNVANIININGLLDLKDEFPGTFDTPGAPNSYLPKSFPKVNYSWEIKNVYDVMKKRRREYQNLDHNDPRYIMRHCLMSCEMAKKYGDLLTQAAGFVNEIQGFVMWDIPRLKSRIKGESEWAFQLEDLVDNNTGVDCAKSDDCFQCCKCKMEKQ